MATRSTKDRPAYRCSECGFSVPKWVGRCPECQAWGSVEEAGAARAGLHAVNAGPVSAPARPIGGSYAAGISYGPAKFRRLVRSLTRAC